MTARTIAAFSGGKDSTAMILAMRDRGEAIDGLLVTPTGDELPELWTHWDRIAALVGCELIRPKAPTLREAIDAVGGLPNFRMRWCTRMIKVEPMIAWARAQADDVVVCVGLVADPIQHCDRDGNPVSLETLCAREPAWAASRIRVERAEAEALRALLARCVKYAREDRMRTPGKTRLDRALAEAERMLEVTRG